MCKCQYFALAHVLQDSKLDVWYMSCSMYQHDSTCENLYAMMGIWNVLFFFFIFIMEVYEFSHTSYKFVFKQLKNIYLLNATQKNIPKPLY